MIRKAWKVRPSLALRDEAVATPTGLDAHRVPCVQAFGASSVALDPKGERLLMGGLGPDDKHDRRAKLWNIATDTLEYSAQPGLGPAAFWADRPAARPAAPPDG